MSITEYILSAFRCLTASKMRTFLTTLGIVVGISSVILINTIGSTISKTMSTALGDLVQGNQFAIMLFDMQKFANEGDMSGTEMTEDMIRQFEDAFDGRVKRVTASMVGHSTLNANGEESSKIIVYSVSPNTITSLGVDIIDGRFITEEDIDNCSASVVITEKTAEKLFGKDASAVGRQVNVSQSTPSPELGRATLNATVVGVTKDKIDINALGLGGSDNSPQMAIFPYSYIDRVMGSKVKNSNSIQFIAPDDISPKELKEVATELYTPYLAEGEMVYTESSTEEIEMVDTIINVLTLIIAAIAAVSLIVGGIGVMNIMLVSVNERTMEIGVRKAMGADNKSIRLQFITESIVISLIGSVIGIVLGLIEAKLMAMLAIKFTANLNLPISIDLTVPLGAIIGSVVFSFVVGLVFGVYPADKAAKMEVVDALRYE
ncbi:ABC transporter permease [Ruminococcus sp. HUN007]|uniref:ABC transporter permease n=1 Tax=Ruminococcus sp. HUN007 TaxID=1514668 RepID=UPI000A53D9A8|nr:ABC transporter permease [Ruminococcus sp. HUN007]